MDRWYNDRYNLINNEDIINSDNNMDGSGLIWPTDPLFVFTDRRNMGVPDICWLHNYISTHEHLWTLDPRWWETIIFEFRLENVQRGENDQAGFEEGWVSGYCQ